MRDVFNLLVQHMSFKDADHEKMEYLLASVPRPGSIFATQLNREPLVKPTASPSQLQHSRGFCCSTHSLVPGHESARSRYGSLFLSRHSGGERFCSRQGQRAHRRWLCALHQSLRLENSYLRQPPRPFSLTRHVHSEHLPSSERSADEPKKRKEPFKQSTLTPVKRAPACDVPTVAYAVCRCSAAGVSCSCTGMIKFLPWAGCVQHCVMRACTFDYIPAKHFLRPLFARASA